MNSSSGNLWQCKVEYESAFSPRRHFRNSHLTHIRILPTFASVIRFQILLPFIYFSVTTHYCRFIFSHRQCKFAPTTHNEKPPNRSTGKEEVKLSLKNKIFSLSKRGFCCLCRSRNYPSWIRFLCWSFAVRQKAFLRQASELRNADQKHKGESKTYQMGSKTTCHDCCKLSMAHGFVFFFAARDSIQIELWWWWRCAPHW